MMIWRVSTHCEVKGALQKGVVLPARSDGAHRDQAVCRVRGRRHTAGRSLERCHALRGEKIGLCQAQSRPKLCEGDSPEVAKSNVRVGRPTCWILSLADIQERPTLSFQSW